MTRRARWTAAVGAVALLAGCGTATGSPVAQTTPGRATSCTGQIGPDAGRGRLPASAHVVGALMCWQGSRLLPERGEWRVRLEARATGDLARHLDAALHEPDVPRAAGVGCPAIAYLTPDLQVDLADGTTARPALPQNGCGAPLPHVTAVLDRLRAASAARVVPVEQQRSAGAVAAGCVERWKDVLTGLGQVEGSGAPLPTLSGAAPVSVCAYDAREGDLALVRSGATTAGALGRLEPTPRPATPCPATVSGALELRLGPSHAAPTALVETGGCGRVVDPEGRSLGYLPAAVVARLAALAITPKPGG
ncbi:MAG: hypothetical protein ACTHOD_08530 [Motilibacteraceae bacterium]